MPSFVGLEQQGFYEPFKLLQAGLLARAVRLQRDKELAQQQQRIGIEQQNASRAGEELGIKKKEFELQQPVLSNVVRQTKNTQAVQQSLNDNPPSSFFNAYPPEERVSRLQGLKSAGFNGDPEEYIAAHDRVAGGMNAPTSQQMMMRFFPGAQPPQGAGHPSPDAAGAPGPAAPSLNLAPAGGLPPMSPTLRVNRPTVDGSDSAPEAPPQLGYRATPSFNEKGQFYIKPEAVKPGLTTGQRQDLREHPSNWASLPDYQREDAKGYVEGQNKAATELRSVREKSAPITNYLGSGEHPGLRQVKAGLDSLVNEYRDPKSGQIDWSKVNAADAFSIIFSEGKVNDPNAVIRQQEFENIAKQAGISEKVENLYARFAHGRAFPPALLQRVYHLVEKKADGAKSLAFQDTRNLEKEAKRYDVPMESLFNDPDYLSEYSKSQTVNPAVNPLKVNRPGSAPIGATGPVQIGSQAAFEALPKGAKFSFNGRIGIKK